MMTGWRTGALLATAVIFLALWSECLEQLANGDQYAHFLKPAVADTLCLVPCSSRIFRGLLPTLTAVMMVATFVSVYETLREVGKPMKATREACFHVYAVAAPSHLQCSRFLCTMPTLPSNFSEEFVRGLRLEL